MAIRSRADDGKFAIYTVPTTTSTDNAPLTDPDGNAARLRFHSERDYVRVVSTQTGTLTLPTRARGQQIKVDHVLFAHGQASAPMVMGRITNLPSFDGTLKDVPIASMVPVLIDTGGGKYAIRPQLHRWVCLAVDNTYVYLREYGFVAHRNYDWVRLSPTVSQSVSGWTAQSINWVVHVTDFLVSGLPASDPSGPAIKIDDTGVQFGYGKFDSNRRYLRLNETGTDYAAPTERHIQYVPNHALFSDFFDSSLKLSLAGMFWENASDYTTTIPTGPSFTPTLKRCDI